MGPAAELEGAAANVPVMVPALALGAAIARPAIVAPTTADTFAAVKNLCENFENMVISPKRCLNLCSLLTTRSEIMELISRSRVALLECKATETGLNFPHEKQGILHAAINGTSNPACLPHKSVFCRTFRPRICTTRHRVEHNYPRWIAVTTI